MPDAGFVAVVDDDAVARAAVARLLRAHGIECRLYASAGDFLAALPAGAPDCLIVDVEMPDMNGMDLQRELSRLGAAIPTIMVTGRHSYRDQCRVLGASAYLLKPVGTEQLISAIGAVVGRDGDPG